VSAPGERPGAFPSREVPGPGPWTPFTMNGVRRHPSQPGKTANHSHDSARRARR